MNLLYSVGKPRKPTPAEAELRDRMHEELASGRMYEYLIESGYFRHKPIPNRSHNGRGCVVCGLPRQRRMEYCPAHANQRALELRRESNLRYYHEHTKHKCLDCPRFCDKRHPRCCACAQAYRRNQERRMK